MLRQIAAIALATVPVAAHAQQADPFAIEDNSMMGRKPRVAADRLVPPNAAGELAAVRGKAWWQVLAYCAGMYKYRADSLAELGDTTGIRLAEDKGKQFLMLGMARLEADRKVSVDQADAIIGPEFDYSVLVAEDAGAGENFGPYERRCREVEQRYAEALKGFR
jgi:hypothetical protein